MTIPYSKGRVFGPGGHYVRVCPPAALFHFQDFSVHSLTAGFTRVYTNRKERRACFATPSKYTLHLLYTFGTCHCNQKKGAKCSRIPCTAAMSVSETHGLANVHFHVFLAVSPTAGLALYLPRRAVSRPLEIFLHGAGFAAPNRTSSLTRRSSPSPHSALLRAPSPACVPPKTARGHGVSAPEQCQEQRDGKAPETPPKNPQTTKQSILAKFMR